MPRIPLRSLFALCLVPGLLPAQGDECSGAMPVTVGTYGPFSNATATTSFPWPTTCVTNGGNDIWFVALANATGTATFDTCGSSFDTCIEVLDGSNGCGNLTSLQCNDDTCGTQSQVMVNVTPGQLLYVRVGGWRGASGSITLNVAGSLAPATGFASASNYGNGCYDNRSSFYEFFQDPANFDLSNTSFTMLPTGGGYLVVPGLNAFVPPSPTAAVLAMGDDTNYIQPLTTPFPHGGTSLSSLVAYSNGFVATGANNRTVGTIITANFFNEPDAAWRNWHDYDPGAGGQLTFEEVGGIAYFTWTNVPDYNVPGSASTFQFQFDSGSGSVTFAFQQMSLTGGGGGGHGHMVGYSPGGPSLQPDMIDISAALPGTFAIQANDSFDLTLAASDRPVLGNTLALDTGNVPTNASFGLQIFGFRQVNPGIDLASLGMAGCSRYLSTDVTLALFPTGGAASLPLTIPNRTSLAGVHLYAQSAMLAPGVNALGALSSNGVDLLLGVN